MKHLTREQRYTISKILSTGESQCKIALYLGVSQATISKEIKRNSVSYGKKLQLREYVWKVKNLT